MSIALECVRTRLIIAKGFQHSHYESPQSRRYTRAKTTSWTSPSHVHHVREPGDPAI
jgi:hypothetical protein